MTADSLLLAIEAAPRLKRELIDEILARPWEPEKPQELIARLKDGMHEMAGIPSNVRGRPSGRLRRCWAIWRSVGTGSCRGRTPKRLQWPFWPRASRRGRQGRRKCSFSLCDSPARRDSPAARLLHVGHSSENIKQRCTLFNVGRNRERAMAREVALVADPRKSTLFKH